MTAQRQQEIFAALWQSERTGLPKYQRVVNAVLEAIREGVWGPGDRLPAEEEFVQLTPFSLGTVQRALRDLVNQGLVVRQHGLGSFVAQSPRRLENPWHCRFVADDGVGTVPIYSKAIRRELVSHSGPWSQHLSIDDTVVIQLDRIINIADEFDIFSRFYGSSMLLKMLWDIPMEQLHGANVKKMIAAQCQLPITEIVHQTRIDRFDDEACQMIGLEPGSSGMFMQAIARAGSNLTVYYQEFYIPPGQRSLQFFERTPVSL
ncbi:MAG: GntR family transcriptional regulator [Burkholderiaceae bacterium]|nr:GntR family transcriptional regulator [Burkholderiaceae bacterium]